MALLSSQNALGKDSQVCVGGTFMCNDKATCSATGKALEATCRILSGLRSVFHCVDSDRCSGVSATRSLDR